MLHEAVLATNKSVSFLRNTSLDGDSLRDGTKTTLSIDSFIQRHVPDMGLGRGTLGESLALESIGRSFTKLTGLLPSNATLLLSLPTYIARTMTEMIRRVASAKRRQVKIISNSAAIVAILPVFSYRLVVVSA